MNKRKLTREILGLTFLIFLSAALFYLIAVVMLDSLILSYCTENDIYITLEMEWVITSWKQNVSFAASAIIFVLLFLFLVGEKVDNAAKKLQEQEKAIREERELFVRSLSHDIRTPLTSILSYTEYMKSRDDVSFEELKGYLEMMAQKGMQMRELTNQLLERGGRKLEQVQDGKLLIEQLTDEWVSILEETFRCELDLEKCPVFSVKVDVQEMRRIFDNLASNVEKYAEKTSPVKLCIYEKEKYLILEQSNRIRTNQEGVESRKLGLDNIRRIVTEYGGNVEIKTTAKEFKIRIALFRIL